MHTCTTIPCDNAAGGQLIDGSGYGAAAYFKERCKCPLRGGGEPSADWSVAAHDLAANKADDLPVDQPSAGFIRLPINDNGNAAFYCHLLFFGWVLFAF